MASLFTVVLPISLLFLIHQSPGRAQYDPDGTRGTTENIQEVFTGRCWDYDITRYIPQLPRAETKCEDLWSLFYNAFAYQPPCYVNLNSYKPFLDAAKQSVPANKMLFWSGVFSLAHRYGAFGQRYVTLEDTLIGYLANSVTWCGQDTEPGVNFRRCPAWDDCPLEASESFWAGASKTFAQQARGVVTLMLDGSNPVKKAYRRDSFFGKFELPNLGQGVTGVKVIVSHVLGQPKVETCGAGSLLDLQRDVMERGFKFVCEDDPWAVMHLLCVDDPASKECVMLYRHKFGHLSHKSQHPTQRPALNTMPDMMSHEREEDLD